MSEAIALATNVTRTARRHKGMTRKVGVEDVLLRDPDAPPPYAATVTAYRVSASPAELAAFTRCRDFYRRAVKTVAEDLRPRFESGELRGWKTGDNAHWPGPFVADNWSDMPPMLRLENEIAFRFTNNSRHTFLVLMCSPFSSYTSLKSGCPNLAAEEYMAMDVVEYARRQGWLRRASGVRS